MSASTARARQRVGWQFQSQSAGLMSSSPLLVSRTSSYLEWIEEAHALFIYSQEDGTKTQHQSDQRGPCRVLTPDADRREPNAGKPHMLWRRRQLFKVDNRGQLFKVDNRGLGCIFISDLKCNFKLLQLPKYRELVLRLDRARQKQILTFSTSGRLCRTRTCGRKIKGMISYILTTA